MRTPEMFLSETRRLFTVVDDSASSIGEKLRALCDLYFWYQNDIHNQAKIVRRIEDISKIVK